MHMSIYACTFIQPLWILIHVWLKVTPIYKKDFYNNYTIRCSFCHILVLPPAKRCNSYSEYRKTLNVLLQQQNSKDNNQRTSTDSHTNYHFLSSSEMNERLQRLHVETVLQRQQIKRISEKLEHTIDKHGIPVDNDLHQDLVAIMDSHQPLISEQYPQGSFQRIFWEQQYKASQLGNSKSMNGSQQWSG